MEKMQKWAAKCKVSFVQSQRIFNYREDVGKNLLGEVVNGNFLLKASNDRRYHIVCSY